MSWTDFDVSAESFLSDKIVAGHRVQVGRNPIFAGVNVHGGDENTAGIGDSYRYYFSEAVARLSTGLRAVGGWCVHDASDQDSTDISAGHWRRTWSLSWI